MTDEDIRESGYLAPKLSQLQACQDTASRIAYWTEYRKKVIAHLQPQLEHDERQEQKKRKLMKLYLSKGWLA